LRAHLVAKLIVGERGEVVLREEVRLLDSRESDLRMRLEVFG
jgi:hypothetical protein